MRRVVSTEPSVSAGTTHGFQLASIMGVIKIACVGDSIAAGSCGFPGRTRDKLCAWPALLGEKLGAAYEVVNLAANGRTMSKSGSDDGCANGASYWDSEEFRLLTSGVWDMIIIALGTNDTKTHVRVGGGLECDNWRFGPPGAELDPVETYKEQMNSLDPTFCKSYKSFLSLAKTLGREGREPQVFVCTAPPALGDGLYNTNQSVINAVLPHLVPLIAEEGNIPQTNVIDLFTALGGRKISEMEPGSSAGSDPSQPPGCFYSDGGGHPNSGDNLHPTDRGFEAIAEAVRTTLVCQAEGG
jgi:lysophospholipase L1-like esterase